MDAWRDQVVFGAYTPDPEVTPPVLPVTALPADAPSPIVWHRRPSRAVQAVKIGLSAVAFVFGVGLLGSWIA